MSNTITTTVFYRTLNVEGWKSSIAKPVPGMLPPCFAAEGGVVRCGEWTETHISALSPRSN